LTAKVINFPATRSTKRSSSSANDSEDNLAVTRKGTIWELYCVEGKLPFLVEHIRLKDIYLITDLHSTDNRGSGFFVAHHTRFPKMPPEGSSLEINIDYKDDNFRLWFL
jgi:hypothetical protein